MKKILSLLSIISLSTIITTNIIACNSINKNKKLTPNTNNIPNTPNKPQYKPQYPSINSNWKLVDRFYNEKNNENKYYFGIIKVEPIWKKITWIGKRIDLKYQYKDIYRWDGVGEPIIPELNSTTGEITNWNEKIES